MYLGRALSGPLPDMSVQRSNFMVACAHSVSVSKLVVTCNDCLFSFTICLSFIILFILILCSISDVLM